MDKQYELNGVKYSLGTIPPSESIPLEIILAKSLGEPLLKLAVDKTEAKGVLFTAGTKLLSTLDADEIVKLTTTALKYVRVDGKPCVMEQHFNGKPKDRWLVTFQQIAYNYRDFFPEGLFDSLRSATPTE